MITNVMAAFDKKARAFMTPFFSAHVDVAIRSFKQAATTPDHQVSQHPEDFSLYHLGTYNDENAVFTLLATPAHVAEALSFQKAK